MAAVEPITATPARSVAVPAMRHAWRDVAFIHWPITADLIQPLLPKHVRADMLDGTTYLGLIGLRIRVALAGAVPVPWLGTFNETHFRVYSVDRSGRRGGVFLTLNANRLLTSGFARLVLRVPYTWSPTRITRHGETVTYTTHRRWPRGPATLHFSIRVGQPCTDPTPLEQFVTARWSMHSSWLGRSLRVDTEHPTWPLFRAELAALDLPDSYLCEAGLPALRGAPASVLFSPGVEAKFGLPTLV